MINNHILKSDNIPYHDISPLTSIIIPAKNEESFITNTLSSLKFLNYEKEKIEIIVINNGSTDQTKKVAENFGAKVIDVTAATVGKLRNIGAQAAKGEFLAFLDADCVPTKNWLKNACALLLEEDCVTGCQVSCPINATWIEKAWFSDEHSGRNMVKHINSGNLLIRKNTFFRIGGFDDSLITGEDAEFCARAIKQVKVIEDGAIRVVHLGNPKKIWDFFRREIWHGLGAFGTFRHNWLDKPLLATALFTVSSLALVAGLAIHQSAYRAIFLLLGLTIPVCIAILSAGMKCVKRRKIIYFLPLIALYFAYFTGRAIALVLLACRIKRYQRVRY